MYDSLQPHGLQHTRPPCPSPTPRVYSNLCPLSRWCHPTISASVIPFSPWLQSFPASGSFPVSQFFTSGGQNIGASVLASVLPANIQDWFPLGLTGWISLLSKGLWRVFSSTQFENINSLALSLHGPAFISVYDTGKIIALTIWTFVGKVMSTFVGENRSYPVEIPSTCSLRQRLPSAHQVLILLISKSSLIKLGFLE